MLAAFTFGFVLGAAVAAAPAWWRRRQVRIAFTSAARARQRFYR